MDPWNRWQGGVKAWKSVFVTNKIHTSKQVSLRMDAAVQRIWAIQVTKKDFPILRVRYKIVVPSFFLMDGRGLAVTTLLKTKDPARRNGNQNLH